MDDTANAALPAEIPRSVSKDERWVMTPFWLIEIRNKVATMIQKIRDRGPSPTEEPLSGVGAERIAWGRARTREAQGSPIASTPAPRSAKDARQPALRIRASATGGKMMAPAALPPSNIENATPRRCSNQVVSTRE